MFFAQVCLCIAFGCLATSPKGSNMAYEEIKDTSESTISEGRFYASYPNCKRLRFLLDLFEALGLTPNSYAACTPNPTSSSSSLRAQLNYDDMKLSKAKGIVKNLGYRLNVEIIDNSSSVVSSSIDTYQLVLPKSIIEKKAALADSSHYENLGFLWRFMITRGLTKRRLSQDLGLTSGAIAKWFSSDDIAISHLFHIKDVYGVSLRFTISDLSSSNP